MTNYEAEAARLLSKAEASASYGHLDVAYAYTAMANGYSALTASVAAVRAIELAEL